MKRTIFRRSLVALAVAGALGSGLVLSGEPALRSAFATSAPSSAQVASIAAPIAARTAPDFAAIVDRYGPAVVNIAVTGSARPASDRGAAPGFSPDDPFWEFFRRFGPGIPQGRGDSPVVRGQGSGFIINADGLILTNAHVVADAQQVRVKLTDRREFDAKVVGIDRTTDVALIRIDAKNLPTVRLGDPASLKVGDPVLAIGSPFGFENTATSGIVSAKSRSLPDGTYVPFIQTDVAVNPGNSGGPLFNASGEVVGINSQIYSRSGGYQGLSFAIPIDLAMRIQGELAQHGKVERARLGVTIQEVDQALADAFRLPRPQGALVSSVEPGSPADKAGLKPGDVILSMQGRDVEHSADLPARVGAMKPGSMARLEVLRAGKRVALEARLARLESRTADASGSPGADSGRLGLAVRPLQPDEKGQAGVAGGLLVEQASGPAAKAGIRPGDVILSMNGASVTGVEQFRALVAKAPRHVALLVQRGDGRLFVPVELG